MYGENRLVALVAAEGFAEDRNKCCLPVVSVDDIRLKACQLCTLYDRAAEETEPFTVITESIEAVTFEIEFVVYEIVDHAFIFQFVDAHVLASPGYRDFRVAQILHLLAEFVLDGTVQRHDYAAVDFRIVLLSFSCMFSFRKGVHCCRQGSGYFSKSAGACERHDFRRSK